MNLETPGARQAPDARLAELEAEERFARERYQLYKAKAYGQRPTSPERLRELQRAYEQAQARLSFAEAEEQRTPNAGEQPSDPQQR